LVWNPSFLQSERIICLLHRLSLVEDWLTVTLLCWTKIGYINSILDWVTSCLIYISLIILNYCWRFKWCSLSCFQFLSKSPVSSFCSWFSFKYWCFIKHRILSFRQIDWWTIFFLWRALITAIDLCSKLYLFLLDAFSNQVSFGNSISISVVTCWAPYIP